jgi:hypothetical protein
MTLRYQACPVCNGTGFVSHLPEIARDQQCNVCYGTGIIATPIQGPVWRIRNDGIAEIIYTSAQTITIYENWSGTDAEQA